MTLNNPLLPHQQQAVGKLRKLKVGALFMEQGTGKTITALELIRLRREAGKIDAVIWLCPCSAKGNIRREIIKQCPEDLLSLFTICGVETLSTSVRALSYLLDLSSRLRSQLVVDESLLIKNPQAYRTKHILQIAGRCPYRLILNGTPVSRNEADLYSQFYLLDWRILGYRSYWSFAANHLEYDNYGQVRRVLATDVLAEKIAPYTFQVKKDDCLSLPDKHHQTEYFYLSEAQAKEYEWAAEILLNQLSDAHPETIYRLFSGLQAVISGKRLSFSSGGSHFETREFFTDPRQNPRIQLVLRTVPVGEKAILFCRYESEISQLCALLPNAVRFDGTVSVKQRDEALRSFSGEAQYLVANKNCAGYSLNLQFCHIIINVSHDWDLGTRLQSEDRIHRLGQEHEVQIIDICAADTLDERILDCLIRKEGLLDSLKAELASSTDKRQALKHLIHGRGAGPAILEE